MSIYKYRFILPMLLLFSVVSVQQAFAAQPMYWARWEIALDFVNDKPNATILVEAGHYVHGQPVTTHSAQKPIDCEVIGSVEIADEQAHFDGGGYLECESPDVVEIVQQMTGGRMGTLSKACDCKTPWIKGTLALDQTPSQPNSLNPIFTRSDLALAVPHVAGNNGEAVFTVDGETAVSNMFDLSKKDMVYADFTQQTSTSYVPSFMVNGRSKAATPTLIQAKEKLQISNTSETFYIGFDPDNGELFEGTLLHLQIDPGCFGFG